MNVLIIDDEVRLTEALSQILEMHNYDVKGVCTSTEGLDEALSGRYDIILLDVMLPVMDGFEVLFVRQRTYHHSRSFRLRFCSPRLCS